MLGKGFSNLLPGGDVVVLKDQTKGFYDIALSNRVASLKSPDFEWSSVVFRWAGDHYVSGREISNLGYDESVITLKDGLVFSGDHLYKTFYQKGFFTILAKSEKKTDSKTHYIGNFTHSGILEGRQEISDKTAVSGVGATYKYIDPVTKKSFVAVPFSVGGTEDESAAKTKVGIAIIDDSGLRIKSKIMQSGSEKAAVLGAAFLVSSNQKQLSFVYDIKSVGGDKETVVQKIDTSSLKKIGDPESFNPKGQDRYISLPGKSDIFFPFPEGTRVAVSSDNSLKLASPKLRDIPPSEIIPNYVLGEGDQLTNPKFKICMVNFQQGRRTSLRVLPNPDSALSISGVSYRNKAIALPVEHFDQTKFYSVKPSQYSLDDILRGRFKPSEDLLVTKESAEIESKKRSLEKEKKKKDCEEKKRVFEEERKKNSKHSDEKSDLDSDEEDGDEDYRDPEYIQSCDIKNDDEFFFGSTTVMILPNAQVVALVATDSVEVVSSPEKYFSTSGYPYYGSKKA